MKVCSCEGCDKPVHRQNLCAKHYFRKKKNGTVFAAPKYRSSNAYVSNDGALLSLYDKEGVETLLCRIDVEDIDRINTETWVYREKTHTVFNNVGRILLARFILDIPVGEQRNKGVSFENGIYTDFRKSNLTLIPIRSCSDYMPKHKKYRGVYVKPDGRIFAMIFKDRKRYYLGSFKTQEEAALAYNEKSYELFGKYAKLNVLKDVDIKTVNAK